MLLHLIDLDFLFPFIIIAPCGAYYFTSTTIIATNAGHDGFSMTGDQTKGTGEKKIVDFKL
jgi:hypothetical protein